MVVVHDWPRACSANVDRDATSLGEQRRRIGSKSGELHIYFAVGSGRSALDYSAIKVPLAALSESPGTSGLTDGSAIAQGSSELHTDKEIVEGNYGVKQLVVSPL